MNDSIASSVIPPAAYAGSRRRRGASAPPKIFRDSAEISAEVEISPASSTSTALPPLVGDGFTFRGKALEKLLPSRHALWAQHRLAVGAPSLELCVNDVNAFQADALRILWFCSHDPSEWSGLRRNPAALEDAICKWADAVPGENVAELTLLGLRIYAEACKVSGF